jgi:hypothetical protein
VQVLYTIPHPPKARTLAELRVEAAARYSVPPENLRILSKDGKELDLATELTSLMEPFKVWITENTGIVKVSAAKPADAPNTRSGVLSMRRQRRSVQRCSRPTMLCYHRTSFTSPRRAWLQEWVFWFNHENLPLAGESVLTHGNVATAAVMQQLEDSANAVLKGTVAGLAVPPATAGVAAPEAPAEAPASKAEAKEEAKAEVKEESGASLGAGAEGSGSAAPAERSEEKPASEASSSEAKVSSNIDPGSLNIARCS